MILPANTSYLNIKKWIAAIDDAESSSPALLGLPSNAEVMLLTRRGEDMMHQLQQLQVFFVCCCCCCCCVCVQVLVCICCDTNN